MLVYRYIYDNQYLARNSHDQWCCFIFRFSTAECPFLTGNPLVFKIQETKYIDSLNSIYLSNQYEI